MAVNDHDSSVQIYNKSESDQIFSLNICHLKYWSWKKNEGRGTHFGILSYWHFSKEENSSKSMWVGVSVGYFVLVSQSQQSHKTTKGWPIKRAKPCYRMHTHSWHKMIFSQIENAFNNMFTDWEWFHTDSCRWSVGQQSTLRMFTISHPSPWLVS